MDQSDIDLMKEKIDFLMFELQRLNEKLRQNDYEISQNENIEKTKHSFDYQWKNIPDGNAMVSDESFMAKVSDTICEYLGDVEKSEIYGMNVADVGCGIGRFTYGFLEMGANVTAIDWSLDALLSVRNLCCEYKDYLKTQQLDLIDSLPEYLKGKFDLVWSYGVVHHTGNVYLAIHNVCKMVKPGGFIF